MIEEIRKSIDVYPDFPRKGIEFLDFQRLLADASLRRQVVAEMAGRAKHWDVQAVVALESRGFLFGMAVAQELQLPLHIVRKAGKLPNVAHRVEYALEYGKSVLEIAGSLKRSRVAVVDDILATGGSSEAAGSLVEKAGGRVVVNIFFIEIAKLSGRNSLWAPVEACLKW